MTKMIKIEGLSKEYRLGNQAVPVLHEIELEIDRGEWVAIMGPSGSGKSTLVNILGCLDVPTAGRYQLDGEEVSRLSEDKLARIRNQKLGFIFQSFNLLPKLTAFENVELPLIYRGVPAKERLRRAREGLDTVGLGDRMHHLPNQLSGGQQQRVAVARALVGDPQVILADEPTGNLDSKSGREVMEIIEGLNAAGRTIILITHDAEVARRGERQVQIRDGRLFLEGGGAA